MKTPPAAHGLTTANIYCYVMMLYCTWHSPVGWVDIGTVARVPLRFVVYL
jgi:hypothetical protein